MMRSGLVNSLLVSLVAAAPTIEPRTGATGYEGYKVLRMETGGQLEKVKDMLSAFQYDEWTHDAARYIDFSISARQAEELKELGASFKELHRDLGKVIIDESRPCDYKGKFWIGLTVTAQADQLVQERTRQESCLISRGSTATTHLPIILTILMILSMRFPTLKPLSPASRSKVVHKRASTSGARMARAGMRRSCGTAPRTLASGSLQ
jgi:hypothetical protein